MWSFLSQPYPGEGLFKRFRIRLIIEDIAWPRGDTNFIFSCWKYPSLMSFAHKWEILSALEHKIHIPARPCNILYTYTLRNIHQAVSWSFIDKWVLAMQSEERTMFFTCGKNNTSNRTRERCFFACEKNYTSSQKSQRCVSFAPKFPLFIGACSLQRRVTSQTFNEKVFLEKFFW